MYSEYVGILDPTSIADALSGDSDPVETTADNFRKMSFHCEGRVDQCLAIMCKMGPSTDDVEVLQRMIEAGMTIAMIPADEPSWDNDKIKECVGKIREANDRVSRNMKMMYPLAIALRIQGSEVHTGENEDGENSKIQLETGGEVTLSFDPAFKGKSNDETIYIEYPKDLFKELVLKPSHRIVFDRGEIKFKIKEVDYGSASVVCGIVKGGNVSGREIIDFPDNLVNKQVITEDALKIIQLGIDLKIDIAIIRYAQCAEDIEKVRQFISEKNSRMKICACIMDHKGFQEQDEIIRAADGIVIVRGYLGSKPLSWNLFLASRTIISKCRSLGKPSIFTTRMQSAQRGEASLPDIANAAQVVLEGADCFNLANEVACGPNPVECIKLLVDICKEANKKVERKDWIKDIAPLMLHTGGQFQSVNVAAVRLSLKTNAAAIIVLTTSGDSASRLSQLRPFCPIIAITRVGSVARQVRDNRFETHRASKSTVSEDRLELARRGDSQGTYTSVATVTAVQVLAPLTLHPAGKSRLVRGCRCSHSVRHRLRKAAGFHPARRCAHSPT